MTCRKMLNPSLLSVSLLVFNIFLTSMIACGDSEEEKVDEEELKGDLLAPGQVVPFPVGDDWPTKTPQEMGMDEAILQKAHDYAFQPNMNTQGVVIVRGGAIVAEWYAEGYDKGSWVTSWSMAKSFTSTLIGILIDEGLIESVTAPMMTFFDEWEGTPKEKITLRSVLWMQSGLEFDENYANIAAIFDQESGSIVNLSLSSDANAYVENIRVKQNPNKQWYYSSADTQLLGAVIQKVTGMNATEYAKKKIFKPLGFSPVEWWVDAADQTYTYCCIDSTVRNFAKFGLLFLRNGNWDGKQIVSEAWVKEATTTLASKFPGYAYQWWTVGAHTDANLPKDLFSAQGLDTQRIFVIPSLDLVIAKNTIYTKPPGKAKAENGWVLEFAPREYLPLDYGTSGPLLWEDSVFLSHIINSIEGAEKVDVTETPQPGGSEDDPVACREEAKMYGTYCEEVHGCTCDQCTVEFRDCMANAQCVEIIDCAFESGCRGIGCLQPCQATIDENGGVGGAGVTLGLVLSECQTECPLECP